MLPVFACAKHGECTVDKLADRERLACCRICADYAERPPAPPLAPLPPPVTPFVRNLLYHIYPTHAGRAKGIWQWNVDQLLRRIDLFNGKRVVAIVTDKTTDPVDQVKTAFRGTVTEFIELPNNPNLREVVTHEALFSRVQTSDPSHVTLYAHAKGGRHGFAAEHGTSPQLWTDMLYQSMLDYWPLVEERLTQFPVAGSFKKVGHGFQGSRSQWHYSGSWFWFRNADLFARDWRRIDRIRFGIEPYPSLHFSTDEAGLIFKDGTVSGPRKLDMFEWTYCQLVLKEFEAWKQANSDYSRAATWTI